MSRHWMPLYVADYLADTMHLTAAESGAYLHLIMHYWTAGSLPNDERKLARIARMTDREWNRSVDTIREFFDASWRHQRIEDEINRATELSNKRKDAALQKHSNSKAKAEQLDTQSQSPLPSTKENIRAVAKTTRPNADFDAFWEARPKRKGADPKDPARKLYEAAVKAGAVPADLLAALRRYAAIEAEHVGTPYLPQMVKWLRDKRWLDYPEIGIQAPNEQTDWDAICSSFKKFGHWSRYGGNHPDSGSCRCPPEILAKHGIVSAAGHDPPEGLRAMQ